MDELTKKYNEYVDKLKHIKKQNEDNTANTDNNILSSNYTDDDDYLMFRRSREYPFVKTHDNNDINLSSVNIENENNNQTQLLKIQEHYRHVETMRKMDIELKDKEIVLKIQEIKLKKLELKILKLTN